MPDIKNIETLESTRKDRDVAMRKRIPNDSSQLKDLSKEIVNILMMKGVNEDIIFDVHVSFEEALRNAMIHGNKSDPGKGVLIETIIADNEIIIVVEDEGEGFAPKKLPDPTLDENLLKEGGRGVYLMRHLMDEVKFENDGRRVIMIKRFDKKHL